MSFDEGENSVLDLLKLTGSLGGSKNGTCHTDRMQQDGGGWHNKRIIYCYRQRDTDGMTVSHYK